MPKHTIHLSLASALEVVNANQEKVVELDRWAEIGVQGASQLATALRTNDSLEVLILGSQNIGPDGAQVRPCGEMRCTATKDTQPDITLCALNHQALGDVLRKNMKLKELHLHNNRLGYEGVEKLSKELAKPLSKNSSKPGNKVLQVLVYEFATKPNCLACGKYTTHTNTHPHTQTTQQRHRPTLRWSMRHLPLFA
jgi:Ran GTPase-activating protein (RanGAP) involved in mRNA processing and transport